MGQPAARVGDMTVTGDPITGPGVATVLIGSMPASVIGDVVSGATLIGAISKGSATVLIQGRMAARVGDIASGVHAVTGVPLTSPVAPPGCPTVLMGG
ncbi:MAG: PAAR domain-containing protein [Phycisphaerales bacterium]|nr:PAAR domain-containing protein [Phycisphaerales bacterium]MCB9840562.1 PAAR domain-containing protein [Phycisphaeraceae bacterium]